MALSKITADSIAANAVNANSIGYTPANKAGDTFTGVVTINADPGQSAGTLLRLKTTTAGDNFITFENTADANGWVIGTETGTPTQFDFWAKTGASYTRQMALDASGRLTLPNNPVFYATTNGTTIAANTAAVLYANIVVNRGSCYSANTGRFTAPVAGAYEFTWGHIGNSTNDVYRMYLEKNGSSSFNGLTALQVRVDTIATGSEYGVGYRNAILELAAGDYISVRSVVDSGSSFYSDTASGYVSFSGRLVG